VADRFDAVLVVSFGGPERREDVLPFLENVLRGRNVPRERMLQVAEHYYHFDGVSPLNQQNRELIAALQKELEASGLRLPVYWGNRNWHPLLADTVAQMKRDGIRRAAALFTSAFSSYSGCRQYLENVEEARQSVGIGAPAIEKLRGFFNHPLFVQVMIERVAAELDRLPSERRPGAELVFTAHSIPLSMASGCGYVRELREASGLVAAAVGHSQWRLAYQSRSGSPEQPWLEPDIGDVLRELARQAGRPDVVVVPIGFLSDHMEVLYDLDTEAAELADELGMNMLRAGTAGTHPKFIRMVRDLIAERVENLKERPVTGTLPPRPDVCASDCCPAPRRPR